MASGTEVGKIYYTLDLDDSALKHGLNESENSVGSFADKLAGIGVKAVAALGAAGAAATAFSIKSAADFEQTRIGLENMLGSADKARSVLKQVSDFAAATPFEFPELAGAVKQLVAFGFSGDDAIATMKNLGDVSAAVGAPMSDLAYLMGTLKTQGKAMTIDIRQFAQRGIPIYEYLGKVLGVNTQKVSEFIEAGKIGFPEVQKAFQLMTAEGGQFHGTMAKQSKSLSGLWSTLQDSIGQAGRELVGISQEGDVVKGSLFDKLREGTSKLIDNMPAIIQGFKQFLATLKPVFSLLTGIIGFLIRNADTIKAWLPVIGSIVAAIYTVITAMKVWAAIQTALNVIMGLNPFAVIAVAIIALIYLIITHWQDFKNIVMAVWQALQTAWDAFLNFIKEHWDIILIVLTGGMGAVVVEIIKHWDAIKQAFVDAWHFVVGVWQGIPGFFSGLWDGIKNLGGKLIDVITSPFKAAFNAVAHFWNSTVGSLSFKAPDWVPGIGGKGFSMPQLPYLARGGLALKGNPYVVGEKGAEVFVPPVSGRVIPNNKLGDMGVGGSSTQVYIYGDIHNDSAEAVDRFADKIFNRLNRKTQLSQQGMTA